MRFSPEECQLIIAPALAEIVGGAEDGEEVFSFFSMHLAALTQAFDALPEMSWDTMHDDLHVEGEIDGEDDWTRSRGSRLRRLGDRGGNDSQARGTGLSEGLVWDSRRDRCRRLSCLVKPCPSMP